MTIILFLAFILGSAYQSVAATYYVDDDGTYHASTSNCDGSDSCEDSIQDAINAASDGDSVIVCPGTYDETITMKTGVDVGSDGGYTVTTVDPTSGVRVVTFDGVSNCTLDGFDLDASTGGATFGDGVIYVNGSTNVTIRNADIHSLRGTGMHGGAVAGIKLNGQVSVSIIDNYIHDNFFAGISTSKFAAGGVSGGPITIKGNTIGNPGSGDVGNGSAGILLEGEGTGVEVRIGGSVAGDSNTISYNGGGFRPKMAGIRLENIDLASIENNNIFNNTGSGILLLDVATIAPHIKNNDIYNHADGAGINIGGASNVTITGDDYASTIHDNIVGIAFYVENNPDMYPPGKYSASSQPVTIRGNDIYNNLRAGIGIQDPITNTVTIAGNDIHGNGSDTGGGLGYTTGGIGIQNDCTLVITQNTIRDNKRGGIHTGDNSADPGGFSGTAGAAVFTIRQNKVHGNGQSGYGGGIDVRHADGTIYNNLVYENHRGGIRFGDWIDEIINNTVADNGNAIDDQGGGIVYDDVSAGGAVNDPPTGTPPATLDIRNNICAYNQKAGIKACFDMTEGLEERDYNLVYANNGTVESDCNWSLPSKLTMSCANKQYGGCGADWDSYPNLICPNDKIADPEFEDRDNDNYRLQSSSPAVDAGDTSYGNDVSIPPGVDTLAIDMGAYGGPYGIDW